MMLSSGTITFLFTDIQSSTPLWEKHPQEMSRALEQHNAIIRQVMTEHDGTIFKVIGDAFQVAFTNPAHAVEAAIEVQRRLNSAVWPEATGELRVRMGIHTGEAEADEKGDYTTSHTLNRVARICSAGHGGQILLSLVSAELAREGLEQKIQFLDLGAHYLKGLSHPEHIFQIEAPGLPLAFPPISSLSKPNHNLPIQRTIFIGRENEISQVSALLESARLVTLTGIGGVGKTRLSIQTAEHLLGKFPDGVWWVELASITNPDRVVDAVAEALSVQEQADRKLIETLENELHNHECLIILDNCEHLIEAVAHLADRLLITCPAVSLLTTSREPLHVEGEKILLVPPLRMPQNGLTDPATLAASEAGHLFLERARAAMPNFEFTNSNSSSVLQICQRLDGIPLAIELAAARVPVLQVSQIAARLDHVFRLLTGSGRTTVARHQTLLATIDWSYQLLSPSEQKLFERLSIFVGGWTLDAAENICTDDTIDQILVLDLLTNLVDKSLVILDRHPGKKARYRFLEPIRQYARNKLEDSGKVNDFARKHLGFYLTFAEANAVNLIGEEQVSAMKQMEAEGDNLRAALAWSLSGTASEQESIRMVIALGRYWLVRGNLHEGRSWMSAVLGKKDDCTCPEERAKALDQAALMAYQQSDYTASKAAWEESLDISRQLGEDGLRGVHLALTGLAMTVSETGDYQTSAKLFSEGLEITRKLKDELSEANILRNLGWIAMRAGDYPQAKAFLEQAGVIFRKFDERVWLSSTISGLGEVATRQGDLTTAKDHLEEALALRRELDNKWGIGATLGTLGWVAMSAGDYEGARRHFGESLTVRQELGDKGGIAWCLEKIAQTSQIQGNYQQAIILFGAAAALRKSINSVIDLADQPEYDALIRELNGALGESAYKKLWDQGAAMNIDRAVAAALSD
jgi:predicted ATPase/class 3 adenylate cyclase/Tfp pilus assembly protein PilF